MKFKALKYKRKIRESYQVYLFFKLGNTFLINLSLTLRMLILPCKKRVKKVLIELVFVMVVSMIVVMFDVDWPQRTNGPARDFI